MIYLRELSFRSIEKNRGDGMFPLPKNRVIESRKRKTPPGEEESLNLLDQKVNHHLQGRIMLAMDRNTDKRVVETLNLLDKKVNHQLQGGIMLVMDQNTDKRVVKTYHHQDGPPESLNPESVMIPLRMKTLVKNGIPLLSLRDRRD